MSFGLTIWKVSNITHGWIGFGIVLEPLIFELCVPFCMRTRASIKVNSNKLRIVCSWIRLRSLSTGKRFRSFCCALTLRLNSLFNIDKLHSVVIYIYILFCFDFGLTNKAIFFKRLIVYVMMYAPESINNFRDIGMHKVKHL